MSAQVPAGSPAAREESLAVGRAQLHYRIVGQGTPLLVLHGGPGYDHSYLLPDMDRLADAFRLIYLDQRGRGKSGRTADPGEITVQSEVDDIEALRAHLGLEQIALMGHSWGGLLAMEYAIRHPGRVSRLVLLNTAPASHEDAALFIRERDGNAPGVRELESTPAYEEGDLEAVAAASRAYFRATLRSEELLDRLIGQLHAGWTKEDVLRSRAIGGRLWAETYLRASYDLLPKLTRIGVPALVLHGDYDFIPVTCAARIAESIPDASLVVLSDCGHFSYLEQPDAVREVLTGFFRRAPGSGQKPR